MKKDTQEISYEQLFREFASKQLDKKYGSRNIRRGAACQEYVKYQIDLPAESIPAEGDRLREMMLTGYKLDYHATDHATFENNLMVVDSFMPQIIAQALANH